MKGLLLPSRIGVRFGRRPMLTVGLAIVAAFLAMAVFAPQIAAYDPIYHDTGAKLLPPSWAHPFGTDNFGRDVLSRIGYRVKG